MNKLFANIVSSAIRNREKRHQVKRNIMEFHLKDIVLFWRFAFTPSFSNRVLLVETNVTHSEVMAGYIPYFQKLGFEIDILINENRMAEAPFCRLDMKGARVFACDYVIMRKILAHKKVSCYKHILLTSSARYPQFRGDELSSALAKYPGLAKLPSLLVVEHDLNDIERFGEEELLAQNRLITLGRFSKGVFVCPFLFGACKRTPKGATTRFIVIGAIKGFRKNHQALIEAVEKLAAENLDFKVEVVGLGELENLPRQAAGHIEILGRLDFPKMFDRLEDADFFLPLLDAATPEHERYITTGVTGSAQLIYAFSKVPVIHPKFAAFYGFDKANAIVEENLAFGMRKAIAMSSVEYEAKQDALADLAKSLEETSLENLKKILD